MILKFNLRWFYSRYPAIKATAEENMYLCNWTFDWNPPWKSLTAFPLWQQAPSLLYIQFFFSPEMLSKTVTNQTVFSWPEPGSNITMTLMRLRQLIGKLYSW